MITQYESIIIGIYIQGLFYGLYTGIFVVYLYYASKKSTARTSIIFYSLCLLYALSTITIASDLAVLIVHMRAINLPPQLRTALKLMINHLSFLQTTASGLCDFIAQFTLIYRCWIVWGKRKRVVIIPSFLTIAYLVTWLAPDGTTDISYDIWGATVTLTSFILSIVVNALVTGLIVFKIFKVFIEVERTLTSINGGATLRHIIFVIIESGIALLVVQVVRVVVGSLPASNVNSILSFNIVIGIHQMFNGITPTIILVRVSMGMSFNDHGSLVEAVESLRCNYPPSDCDPENRASDTLEKKSDDIRFNSNPSSDSLESLQIRRMGSTTSSSMTPQERSENT